MQFNFHVLRWTITSLFLSVLGLSSWASAGTITFDADRGLTILAGQPTTNYGALNFIQTGRSANAPTRSLVSFDVSPLSGMFTQIDSVTLRLHLSGVNDNATKTTNVYAISNANSDWVEGTGNGSAGVANWNARRVVSPANWAGSAGLNTPGSSLTQPGIDYVNTLLASETFINPTSIPANTLIDFEFTGTTAELTSLIDNWVDLANAGLLLLDPNESTMTGTLNRMMYHSDDASTAAFRPQLIVTFTYIPVPEPSSFLLLGIGALILTSTRRPRRNT